MMDTPPDALLEKIESLQKQAAEVRNQRNLVVKDLGQSIEQRDKSNEEFQKRKVLTQQLREKRDALNLKVQECKQKRNGARDAIQKKREEVKRLKEEFEKLKGQFPGIYEETSSEIQKLEWIIQTEPLSPDRERALVVKIASLEAGIKVQKRRHDIKGQLGQLRSEIAALKGEAAHHHAELKKLVAESETFHSQMLAWVGEATAYKEQADKAHQSFVEAKNKANELQRQIFLITAQINGLKKNAQESSKKEQMEKQEEIKKKMEESATDKMRRGEKLSFEEFKILIEKGAI